MPALGYCFGRNWSVFRVVTLGGVDDGTGPHTRDVNRFRKWLSRLIANSEMAIAINRKISQGYRDNRQIIAIEEQAIAIIVLWEIRFRVKIEANSRPS